MTTAHQLDLKKSNGDRFIFTYMPGEETQVLDALIDRVNARDSSFDWLDAAALSHQLGQQIAADVKAKLAGKDVTK
jgi:hypothetical protein